MPRKAFDGIKLADDIAQMQAADKMSPPSARPSLMDAVRQLATYIETRAKLGWTDAMIAAVLTEAGYAIEAATLRSYRARLRHEGLLPPRKGKAPKQSMPALTPVPAVRPPAPVTAQPIPIGPPAPGKVGVADTTASVAEPIVDSVMSRAPPGLAPAPSRAAPRRFSIDPTKRPADRA